MENTTLVEKGAVNLLMRIMRHQMFGHKDMAQHYMLELQDHCYTYDLPMGEIISRTLTAIDDMAFILCADPPYVISNSPMGVVE